MTQIMAAILDFEKDNIGTKNILYVLSPKSIININYLAILFKEDMFDFIAYCSNFCLDLFHV